MKKELTTSQYIKNRLDAFQLFYMAGRTETAQEMLNDIYKFAEKLEKKESNL
tara:strand:+ start:2448 stop:2603 length:156 start_codon:yes stop_codon:yes gene_type:complete